MAKAYKAYATRKEKYVRYLQRFPSPAFSVSYILGYCRNYFYLFAPAKRLRKNASHSPPYTIDIFLELLS